MPKLSFLAVTDHYGESSLLKARLYATSWSGDNVQQFQVAALLTIDEWSCSTTRCP
jgi:hypothetical protein